MAINVTLPIYALEHRKASGLHSATFNLAKGICAVAGEICVVASDLECVSPEFRAWLKENRTHVFEYGTRKMPSLSYLINQTLFANFAASGDLVIYPNYLFPPRLLRKSVKSSVFIHDCQHREIPELFSRKRKLWLDMAFKHALRSADEILLISEFERGQIARYFGDANLSKCRVVYNSIDWSRFDNSEPGASGNGKPYILSVSQQYAHKNTETVLRAFNELGKWEKDIELYLVGHPSETAKQVHHNECENVRDRVHFLGFVSDEQLGTLYKGATLFVLASRYEGFGMSAVEAMGMGVATLVSNTTALPEVTLGEASYLHPDDSYLAWADAMRSFLYNPISPQRLESLADMVRKRYDPKRIARDVLG